MCMDKVKDWLFGEEEEGYTEDYNTAQNGQEQKSNIFENNKTKKTSEMLKPFDANSSLVLFEPRAYSDSQEIGGYLKKNKAAVVNLHRLQKEKQKRVVDFLTGVIFAIDGDIQVIGPKIFLCTPKNIGVTGSITLDDEPQASTEE